LRNQLLMQVIVPPRPFAFYYPENKRNLFTSKYSISTRTNMSSLQWSYTELEPMESKT